MEVVWPSPTAMLDWLNVGTVAFALPTTINSPTTATTPAIPTTRRKGFSLFMMLLYTYYKI
jgi:hypothetical protein